VHTKRREWLRLRLFLEHYHKDHNEFLGYTVQDTGDETWVSFVNVETKEQSKQWMHTHSLNKPNKLNNCLPARKLMATVFWYRKGVLMVNVIHATTDHNNITCIACETLKKTA
jgi:hypothetical protein